MDHETVRELTAAYALDALDALEERDFEGHLAHCDECREEVVAFQEAAALLAYDVDAPEPPAGLRARILEQAGSERANVVSLRPRWAFRAAASAAAVAAAAAVALGIWAASLRSDLSGEREARGDQALLVAVLADPAAERIPVEGAEGSLVVARSGDAALLVEGLEAAPAGKVYEAWVIRDGKPLPAGTFGGGSPAALRLTRPVPAGSVVAVTLEPGEMEEPTGRPLFTATT